MNDRLNRIIPDYGDYSPDALLADLVPAAKPGAEEPSRAPEQPNPDISAREQPAQAKPARESRAADMPPAGPATAESIAERSRRIVMSALGETLLQYRRNPDTDALPEDLDSDFDFIPHSKGAEPARYEPEPDPEPEAGPEPGSASEPGPMSGSETETGAEWKREPLPEPDPQPFLEKPEPRHSVLRDEPRHPRFIMGEDGIITLIYGDGDPDEALPDEPEASEARVGPVAAVGPDEPAGEDAPTPPAEAAPDGSDGPEPEPDAPAPETAAPSLKQRLNAARQRAARRKGSRNAASFSETVFAPVVRMLALLLAKRQRQNVEAASWPDPEELPDTPELSPRNAAKYYAKRSKRMQNRLRISVVLTAALAWIAFGLPLMGAAGSSVALQGGISLILTLLVMLATIDVVTAGLRQTLDLAPGPEALAVLAALLSCIDAALVLFGFGTALPFCAVGAAALTSALWGSRLSCRALMRTFRTAADSHSPSCISADPGTDKIPRRLFRADRGSLSGLVRRSESQDICRTAYAAAAPIILLAAFILSVAASVGGNGGYFLHTFSALISVGTSFAAFFGFSLPYSIAARRLRSSGAAIAGYDGCADLAKTKEIIITDGDLFPPGTMKFSAINILEGVPQQKVIIAASSLIYAAGSGAAPLFEALAERRGCHVAAPREYAIHESGGLSGVVNGEHVDVGPARFMNLQGIRLPQNMTAKNAVCVAISGELVGVFLIDYTPFTSVQEALVTLLRGRFAPVFAMRDFNITPRMVHDLFKLPSTNFNFPAYRDRTRINPDPDRPIDAVVTRNGMLPFVEAAEAGRRLYTSARIATILSLIGSAIGMVILFLLCRTGAFDTASVGNVLMFMILWALPAVILSYGRGK